MSELDIPFMGPQRRGEDLDGQAICRWNEGPVARVVDITAATLFGCTVVGVLYVVAAGPKGGGSVCYPGTKAFPPEISALLVVAPFLVMGAAGCVYSLNWVLGIRPLCAIRTKNLLHALLAATLAAWLAGCVGNASAGPMAAGMGLFLTAACIVWAWDGGYLQTAMERCKAVGGRILQSIGDRIWRGEEPPLLQ